METPPSRVGPSRRTTACTATTCSADMARRTRATSPTAAPGTPASCRARRPRTTRSRATRGTHPSGPDILTRVVRRARRTEEAVAEAASLDEARAAAGARGTGGAGSSDPLVGELRRAGLLRLLVLHFCAEGPCYGNQLIDRITTLTGGLVAVNPNTMYPMLRSLEAEGLLAGEWEHPEPRSRRFYRITEPGDAEREQLSGQVGDMLDRLAASIDSLREELT